MAVETRFRTNVTDNFNRASLGAAWTTDPSAFGALALPITGSTQLGASSTNDYESYYNTQFGGASGSAEIIITVGTAPATNGQVILSFYVAVGSSYQQYYLTFTKLSGTDTVTLKRADSGGSTQIGSTANQEIVAGNKLAIRKVGSAFTVAYWNGTAWTVLITGTDSTWSGALYGAIYFFDTTVRLDDFCIGSVPAVPASPSATPGDQLVTVAWSTVSGASGYRILYGTSTGNYTVEVDAGNVLTYDVTGLTNGTQYFFEVHAYNSSGTHSDGSSEVSATPTGATAKSGNDSGALTDGTPSIAATFSRTDSAALTDNTPSIAATPATTDSGTLSDASAIAAGIATNDSGTLSDASAVTIQTANTDSGTLSESSALAAAVGTSDSATFSDASSVAAAPTVNDSATLAESVAITVAVAAADSATLTEVSSVFAGANITGTDSGSVTEGVSISVSAATQDGATLNDSAALAITTANADSGALTDSASVATALALIDGGVMSEAASIVVTLAVNDGATLSESASIDAGAVVVAVSDGATLSEAVSILVILAVADSATLSESAVVVPTTPTEPTIYPRGRGVGPRPGPRLGGRSGPRIGPR